MKIHPAEPLLPFVIKDQPVRGAKPDTPVDGIFGRTHDKIILQTRHLSIGVLTERRLRLIQIQLTDTRSPRIYPQVIVSVNQESVHIVRKNRRRILRYESIMPYSLCRRIHLIKASFNRSHPQVSRFVFRDGTDLRSTPFRQFPGNIPQSGYPQPARTVQEIHAPVLCTGPDVLSVDKQTGNDIRVQSALIRSLQTTDKGKRVGSPVIHVQTVKGSDNQMPVRCPLDVCNVSLTEHPFPV